MADWDLDAITAKWQQEWWDAKVQHAERDAGKPSYFIHFAYPGISGYLHVGHMRGFTYSDVFARFKRQTGHNVVFPAGFHASGIPAVAFAKEVERGEKTEYLRSNGYDGPIEAMTDPERVVQYFAQVYTHDYWKRFGFLIDERRNCTTIDPGYQRFIQWQFRKLNEKGYLIQKPHYAPFCPVAGPVAVDKSETDIKQGGSAEIQEFLALRFTIPAGDLVDTDDNEDVIVLPCATLRPETVYGATNVWIAADHEYELVRVWKDSAVADDDESEVWLVSKQGRTKLEWQFERAEGLGISVLGAALIGMTATAPVTGKEMPIVAGAFVDPLVASGIVMSVPAHAPFDWAAYHDAGLDGSIGEPPVIVAIEGYADIPARQACKQHGVRHQTDKDALDRATEQLYADEFNKGILTDACGSYAGRRIKEAKDEIKTAFLAAGHARILRQFSEPVISRAGELVDIKRIPDQDFIHYADPEWTDKAVAHAKTMDIYPKRYGDDIENVLRWFGDRACVRRGAWLGTEFPFKQGWIIEPIADSTFYPWFYLITPYLADGRLGVNDLSDAFFNHVFNAHREALDAPSEALESHESKVPGSAAAPQHVAAAPPAIPAVWNEVRADVLHFGPVDINLGGKEHQTVHFPVYIMNMVGLMDDPALWPRGIFVNWWVTQKAGAKISKSKGGAEPIPGAAARYGVDPMRLYYCHVGSPHVDIEWDPDIVLDYRKHVQRLTRVADDALAVGDADAVHAASGKGAPARTGIDAWLASQWSRHLAATRAAYETYDLRGAASEVVYAVPETLRWYQRRGGADGSLLRHVVQAWAAMLCPMLPHVAEEMWSRSGGQGLCSVAAFPATGPVDEAVLAAEDYLRAALDDIKTVARLAGVERPEQLVLFTAPAWKRAVAAQAVRMAEAAGGKLPMGDFMAQVMQDPEMRALGKPVQQFAARMPHLVTQWSAAQRALLLSALQESDVLGQAASFIAEELAIPTVQVHAADSPDAPDDPKRAAAAPLKPGIILR